MQEQWFMCTALPLMRSIHPQNFIPIASSFGNMHQIKSKYENKQEDHDGPISLTCVLSSKGQQSYVPTCDPRSGASFDPMGIK